jgi:hypothetical protein
MDDRGMTIEFLAAASVAALVACSFGRMLSHYDVYEWKSEEEEVNDPYGLYRDRS